MMDEDQGRIAQQDERDPSWLKRRHCFSRAGVSHIQKSTMSPQGKKCVPRQKVAGQPGNDSSQAPGTVEKGAHFEQFVWRPVARACLLCRIADRRSRASHVLGGVDVKAECDTLRAGIGTGFLGLDQGCDRLASEGFHWMRDDHRQRPVD